MRIKNQESRIRGWGIKNFFYNSCFLRHDSSRKGFTLLFAVLISSILLAIGLSIASTTLKDLLFSSSGRDSQIAFYAADTGAECALYWDKEGKFATSSESIPPDSNLFCNGEDITKTRQGDFSDNWVEQTFSNGIQRAFYLVDGDICSRVEVLKRNDGRTVITAYGYNTCDTLNPRRVERGLRASY